VEARRRWPGTSRGHRAGCCSRACGDARDAARGVADEPHAAPSGEGNARDGSRSSRGWLARVTQGQARFRSVKSIYTVHCQSDGRRSVSPSPFTLPPLFPSKYSKGARDLPLPQERKRRGGRREELEKQSTSTRRGGAAAAAAAAAAATNDTHEPTPSERGPGRAQQIR
jgi:hypothetical protein